MMKTINVLLIGESGSGKTRLLNKILEIPDTERTKVTMGVELKTATFKVNPIPVTNSASTNAVPASNAKHSAKSVPAAAGKSITAAAGAYSVFLKMWECSGRLEFRDLLPRYYPGTNFVVICVTPEGISSLEKEWIIPYLSVVGQSTPKSTKAPLLNDARSRQEEKQKLVFVLAGKEKNYTKEELVRLDMISRKYEARYFVSATETSDFLSYLCCFGKSRALAEPSVSASPSVLSVAAFTGLWEKLFCCLCRLCCKC